MSTAEVADGVVERLGPLEVSHVTGAGDHDELRVRDRLLELATDAERRARVPLPPNKQGRHRDARQQIALVGFGHHRQSSSQALRGVKHDFANHSEARAGALNVFMPCGFEPMMEKIIAWYAEQGYTTS